jgi:hypothetical protein
VDLQRLRDDVAARAIRCQRVNQKGLVERDLTLKEGYFVFQSYWAEKPMVHIYGTRGRCVGASVTSEAREGLFELSGG